MAQLASPDDLGLIVGRPATDPKVLLALRRASDRFEGEIGYAVALTTETVSLAGDGSRALLLPAVPVVGQVAVAISGLPVLDFQTAGRAGVLRRDSGWPDGLDNIVVTYTHGWDKVPGDIADAVLEQAESTYRLLVGVANVQSGSESIGYFASVTTGVTQRWTDTVERYQLRSGDRA